MVGDVVQNPSEDVIISQFGDGSYKRLVICLDSSSCVDRRYSRRCVYQTGGDDELDQVTIIKGTKFSNNEAGGEEDSACYVEGG